MRTLVLALGTLVSIATFVACSADNQQLGFGDGGGGSGATGGATSTGTGGGPGLGGFTNTGGGTSSGGTTCDSGDTEDKDKDGWTKVDGDCNDCDPNVNPAAVEVVDDGAGGGGGALAPSDEDCDGMVDNVQQPCDAALAVDDADPMSAAKAVELCKVAAGPKDSGVVSAKWVLPGGTDPATIVTNPPFPLANFHLGHGVLAAFGPNVNVQAGGRMLGLSSGSARQPTDPGYMDVGGFSKGYTSGHPQGFPKESPACPGVTTGEPHDGTGVELTIRVPSNAHGFSFNFDFYTYEWPGYVCSMFNDFFVALLTPIPANQLDGNISFDSQGNPVSVNNAFVEVCGCAGGPPCNAGGKTFTCPLGTTELQGTGFGLDTGYADHGATSWLQTKAPADPNTEITIRWAVYDSGDGVLDSTTLVDNWQWIAEPGTTVGTDPVPDPK